MDWGGPGFVLAIIAISTLGWIITTGIRARHGYPVTDDWGATVSKGDLDAARRVELLQTENAQLTGRIGRLEERLSVLERIATDPAGRIARDIDALR